MADLASYIAEVAQRNIASEDIFLVDVHVSGQESLQKIRVYIDGDQGVGIDVCSALSRKIGADLEEEDAISGKYILEVSSPGLDQPLRLHRQYVKNTGRKLKVVLNDGRTLKGKLMQVEEDGIVVNAEGKKEKKASVLTETKIEFEQIKKATVLVSFDTL
jgi:ribosome maturation factor RimP